MAYTPDFFLGEANRIRNEIENMVYEGGDLVDYFTDSVYGEEDGRWITGYGVYGGENILVCPTCVTVCGHDSEPFGRDCMEALEEVMQMLG